MHHPKHPAKIKLDQLAKRIQPGDVLAYGGYGIFSKLIKALTKSCVSHMAIMYDRQSIVEAINVGVLKIPAFDDAERYEGDVWYLPLSKQSRRRMKLTKMKSFLHSSLGKKYDMHQAIFSAFDYEKQELAYNRENHQAFFCSELVAGALEEAKILRRVNTSEVTPIDLCRFDIFAKKYYQLKGKPRAIRGFNSVKPSNWGL